MVDRRFLRQKRAETITNEKGNKWCSNKADRRESDTEQHEERRVKDGQSAFEYTRYDSIRSEGVRSQVRVAPLLQTVGAVVGLLGVRARLLLQPVAEELAVLLEE